MAKLTAKELFRADRPERIPTYLKKLENGEKFEMENGPNVAFHKKDNEELYAAIKANDRTAASKIKPVDSNGNSYNWGDFTKSKEFGGGGSGSGAGSAATDLGESAAAVYAQTLFLGHGDFGQASLKYGHKKAHVISSLHDIMQDLPGQWVVSSKLTAQKLFKEYGRTHRDLTFHHASPWVNALENHFKKLNRTEKVFSNINKWSPADIYAVSQKGMQLPITQTKSIAELNALLLQALRSGDIIGISLKLVAANPKLTKVNVDATRKAIRYNGYLPGKKKFFDSKDVYIQFNDGKPGMIQYRTFPSTWQGEIKGATANHGKVGYGPTAQILKDMRLGNNGWIYGSGSRGSNGIRDEFNKGSKKIFETLYKNYQRFAINDPRKLAFDDFVDECKKQGVEWFYSKYMGMELIRIIEDSRKADEFVSKVLGYAASESDMSAPFIKIS